MKKKTFLAILGATLLTAATASAVGTGDTGMVDNLFNFVTSFIFKAGGFVALIGLVQFAIGFQSNNPEGKTQIGRAHV